MRYSDLDRSRANVCSPRSVLLVSGALVLSVLVLGWAGAPRLVTAASPSPSPAPTAAAKPLWLFDARRGKQAALKTFTDFSDPAGASLIHARSYWSDDWQILHYCVQEGNFAGFALGLSKVADWSSFASGELVIRLKYLDPRTVTLPSSNWTEGPTTECADAFEAKLMVKESNADPRITVHVTADQKKQMIKDGYLDFRIPLSEFSHVISLIAEGRPLNEFTITFLSHEADAKNHGTLGIQFIVVSSKRAQTIEDLERLR